MFNKRIEGIGTKSSLGVGFALLSGVVLLFQYGSWIGFLGFVCTCLAICIFFTLGMQHYERGVEERAEKRAKEMLAEQSSKKMKES